MRSKSTEEVVTPDSIRFLGGVPKEIFIADLVNRIQSGETINEPDEVEVPEYEVIE